MKDSHRSIKASVSTNYIMGDGIRCFENDACYTISVYSANGFNMVVLKYTAYVNWGGIQKFILPYRLMFEALHALNRSGLKDISNKLA